MFIQGSQNVFLSGFFAVIIIISGKSLQGETPVFHMKQIQANYTYLGPIIVHLDSMKCV